MNRLNLLFGVHFGNPKGDLERHYRRAYLPFFKTMESHPRFKFSFYMSGLLCAWLKQNHPELLQMVRQMVARRQAEVFCGAYSNAILPLIPDHDKIAQIKKHRDYMNNIFGADCRGIYLTNHVWDPHLPKILSRLEIDYALVPDRDFQDPHGYYVTEEEGQVTNLFPVSSALDYYIPCRKPEELSGYLEKVLSEGANSIVFWGRGESFGVDKGSDVWIYDQGYLDNLLSLIEENASWINLSTFSEHFEENVPRGKIYLPPTAGLNEYKLHNLHKKMLHVSSRMEALSKSSHPLIEEARESLFRGQALHDLSSVDERSEIYGQLIVAETALSRLNHGAGGYTELLVTDFDKDGHEEVLMGNDQLNLYFSPVNGGSVFEIDFKPKQANLCQHPSLKDHFFSPSLTGHDLKSYSFSECGDFIGGAYSFMLHRKKEEVGVTLSRTSAGLKLSKKVWLFSGQSIFHIQYEITNLEEKEKILWFGPEFVFTLNGGLFYNISGRKIKSDSSGILYKVSEVELVDDRKGFGISLSFEREGMLNHFPIEKLVKDEEGYRREHEGTKLIPIWYVKLGANQSWSTQITARIEV
ncbi:hypothetical protein A2276_03690 [candidate division WOR-1 bacterium RIFOXYA12_FULL_43_27]|uniref:Glycoside hydrolase family 57 N-terminal domain-containing protein n=1 Tax=candidate division WOR-1 bacterium RIFOXYC2_FULL_46_14 TaxID=1802587 RepID=A0A1F4U753_UNCSA|nr:MAG: hypothetical protein A2276_03690 [candidate division WOR-1 bacterium RIFOXYA12_FULL_43_27]OGC19203.1 MAG: hypothetical protein A2292_00645 [candidate division WOR-1 bacterium RIFOXYB2_FULL_46_45]OGC30192.1 MAG: hypothetical protein A2232_00645 [candidate division WOR-1 bacterium RIFOXYA2_FULL_46_56]OGC40794.1 MAG: hypothetical protein A2438_00650 [candidate division WOR-1 bacterium RIFOXYC2_FULL_46_14]